MTPHDDPERDAWLTQALRHAPDADAAPPPALGETILRAARNAVKTPQAAAPARTNALLRLWSWLARPSVAAGFATVMVATLVGVMWWDQPLDQTLPPVEVPAVTAAPERSAAPPPVSPAPPEPAETKADASAANVANAAKGAPRAATPPAPPAPAQPARKRERAAAPAAADAVQAEAEEAPKRSADAAAPMATAPSAFPAQAPAPAAAPSPAPSPAPALESAAKPAGATARGEIGEQRAERPSALAKSAAPAAGLSERRQDAAPATPVIDEPERWRWQRGAGPQPMTPALQRWLAQLDRTARWRPATGAPPAVVAGNVLQLWRDGALRTTIQLGDDAVWLTPAGGAPLMAPLAPAAAASLKTTLADAAP